MNRKFFLSLLIVYLIMLVLGVFLLFPVIQDAILEAFEYDKSMSIVLFLMFGICIAFILSILINYISKEKLSKDHDKFYSDTAKSDKNDYIKSEIEKLNERLTATEENWKASYHLLISSQNRQSNLNGNISTSKFLKNFGIEIDDIKIENNSAFVLMPFRSNYRKIFYCISNTCAALKIKAMRSDEEFIQSDILKHVVKCIVKSRVIIAVVDGKNANVFYELGIAHALNKPTILISRVDSSIPFDIQSQYIVLYNSYDELNQKLTENLLKILTNNN